MVELLLDKELIKIESLRSAQTLESEFAYQFIDYFLGLALLLQEGYHLMHNIRDNIPVRVLGGPSILLCLHEVGFEFLFLGVGLEFFTFGVW